MKLYQIKYFIILAQECNFSVAAQKLNIGQPPLSRAIQELERKLGAKLFIRDTRNMKLSYAGQVFKNYAHRILQFLEVAKSATLAADRGHYQEVRIAITDKIDVNRLAQLLSVIREDAPLMHIQLHEVSYDQFKMGLKDGLFDIGFTQEQINEKGLYCKKLWTESFAVLLPKKHPLLAFEEIPLKELVKYPQIVFNPEKFKGFYEQVHRCITSLDARPTIVEYVNAMNILLALVQAGFGVSLVSLQTCTYLTDHNIAFRPLDKKINKKLKTYICHTESSMSDHIRQLIHQVEKLT